MVPDVEGATQAKRRTDLRHSPEVGRLRSRSEALRDPDTRLNRIAARRERLAEREGVLPRVSPDAARGHPRLANEGPASQAARPPRGR